MLGHSEFGRTLLPGIVIDDASGHPGQGAGQIDSGPEPTCEMRRGASNLVKMPRTRTAKRPSRTWMESLLGIEERVAMEMPQVRPGVVNSPDSKLRVVAFFFNAAEGNLAIQLLTAIGIPNDR